MRYTALSGSTESRNAAIAAAGEFQRSAGQAADTEGLFMALDLKSDYANEWFRFVNGSDRTQPATIPLKGLQDRLPFFARGRDARVVAVSVLADTEGGIAIDVGKEILLSGRGDISLEAGSKIGGFCVAVAKSVQERLADDWKVDFERGDGGRREKDCHRH